MLANRVREYTTTTGAGDITLAGALPGHIPFAEGFPVGASVTYVIEDGDDYEIGTGTLADATTLQRTSVAETLVAGVYDKASPTAISLSGNAKVFCAATAEMLLDPNVDADVIREVTPDAGVTVDGVVLKDGSVAAIDAQYDGAVGIGGTPAYPMHIIRDSEAANIIAERTGAGASRAIMQGGNESVFFGSLSSDIAHFGTAGLAAITVDTARNVGIGTTSINNMLSVAGDVFINPSVASQNALTVRGAASHTGNLQQWQNSGGVNLVAIGSDGNFVGQNVRGVSAQFYHTGNLDESVVIGDLSTIGNTTGVYFRTTGFGVSKIADGGTFQWLETVGGQRMALSDTQLTVDVAAQINGSILGNSGGTLSGPATADARWTFTQTTAGFTGTIQQGSSGFTLSALGSQSMLFNTNGVTGITLDSVQNVGIGAAPVTRKLEVTEGGGTTTVAAFLNTGSASSQIGFKGSTGVNDYDVRFGAVSANVAGIYTDNSLAASWDANQNATFSGDLNMSGNELTGVRRISSDVTNATSVISGGSDVDKGANVLLHGESHATNAFDIVLRNGLGTVLHWQAAAGDWDFIDNNIVGVSDILRNSSSQRLLLGGGSTNALGAVLLLRGEADVSEASDVIFRSDNITTLQWDNSASAWYMYDNPLRDVSDMTISGNGITRTVDSGLITIAGGTTVASGGNVVFYGPNHTTNANDIFIRTGATNRLVWDESSNYWWFNGHILQGVPSIIRGTPANELVLSGGTEYNVGSNIVLYGETHLANANDIFFRTDATSRLQWDDSINEWNFHGHSTFGIPVLHQSGTASTTQIAGGSGGASGGNVVFYGPAHATNANDILFRTDATARLHWDHSLIRWDFQNYDVYNVRDLILAGDEIHRTISNNNLTVSGGSDGSLGGAVVLYGESHATSAGDIVFNADNVARLRWDHSALAWNYGTNILTGVSDMRRGSTTGQMHLAGGSTLNQGGNVVFYGESHATQANDISLRAGNSSKLYWDNSTDYWNFQNNNLAQVGDISMYGNDIHRNADTDLLRISGGSAFNVGGNLVLYGQSHSTNANHIVFRSGLTEVGTWDDSTSRWNWRSTRFENVSALSIHAAGNAANLAIRRTNAGGAGFGIGTIDWLNENGSNRGRIAGEFDTDTNSSRLKFEPTDTAATSVTALTVTSTGVTADVDFMAEADAIFNGSLSATSLPEYADDSAAGLGGLAAGDIYRTATGELRCKL